MYISIAIEEMNLLNNIRRTLEIGFEKLCMFRDASALPFM